MSAQGFEVLYPEVRVSLADVAEAVDRLCRAIARTVNLDVAVCDDRGRIIGGTGPYEPLIGNRQPWGRVLDSILDRPRTVIVDNPGYDELCAGCMRYRACPEKIEIDHPITLGETCCGVISLVGFSAEQRVEALARVEGLVRLLQEVADLLSAKLSELRYAKQLEDVRRRLEVVLNLVDEGVIMVDRDSRIALVNRTAEKILRVGHDQLVGCKVDEVFQDLPLLDVLQTGVPFSQRETRCRVRGKKTDLGLVATAHPLFVPGEGLCGVVGTFRPQQAGRLLCAGQDVEHPFDAIVGNSWRIKELKRQAMSAAGSDSTVLIQGESGTGKELVARAIHGASRRSAGPFVAVSCAAIPDQLLESELFGYEEGAFTGARRGGKPGKFELANGGTLFLDEIGDLPLHMQGKLLRVLETRQVERVGGIKSVSLDVRVVAATNRDLEKMVATGAFREDLYYRLNVIPIATPSLRERKEDIPLLVSHFLKRYVPLSRKHLEGVSDEALEALIRYDWPGNVRELQNAVEYAVNMENSSWIRAKSLPPRIRAMAAESEGRGKLVVQKAHAEREAIARALEMFGTDLRGKRKAADFLGISLATLYRKMKRFADVQTN